MTITRYLVVLPLTLIAGAICPVVFPQAVFSSFLIFTGELGPVGPTLGATTLLEVLVPIALISCAVTVNVEATAVSFVVAPEAVIDLPFGMCEDPVAEGSA